MAFDPEVPPMEGTACACEAHPSGRGGTLPTGRSACTARIPPWHAHRAAARTVRNPPASAQDQETCAAWTARRAAGDAIAHITGHLTLIGLDLAVGRNGPLLPPGARRLVEVTFECARQGEPGGSGELSVAEIGTGAEPSG
jgi:methylase of polypeptide subunit release factors